MKKMLLDSEEQKVKKSKLKLKNDLETAMKDAIRKHEERVAIAKAAYNAIIESGEKPETQFRSPRRKFLWTDEIR